jgi:ADP-heptose:LPS heptosyltransferase
MPKPKPHILVIRLSAMGDVAIAVPLINTLVHRYPELEFTVLTKKPFAVLFEDIPRVNVKIAEVRTKHKGIPGLFKLSNELKAKQFAGVADIHNVLRSKILGFFLKQNGLQFEKIDKGRAEKKALTQPKDKAFKPLKSTAKRYAEVFEKSGYTIDIKHLKFLNTTTLGKDISEKLSWNNSAKKIGIAPFAAHEGKTYPSELMQSVLDKLAKQKDLQIYFFGGGKKETEILKTWAKASGQMFCVAGEFDFKTELQIISNLDLMLSMDSGNGHLAAMYGVKVITIWGQTHPYLGFAPYGQTEDLQLLPDREKFPFLPTSVYGNTKGIDNHKIFSSISPEAVADKIKSALQIK